VLQRLLHHQGARARSLSHETESVDPYEHSQERLRAADAAASPGESGRSLFHVLTDTIEYLRSIRTREPPTDAPDAPDATDKCQQGPARLPAWVPGPLAIDDDTLQEGMRSSHSLVVMEVEMPNWTSLHSAN